MDTTPYITLRDPVALVRQLDPDAIRERLAAIARERNALLALLRAALAAQRDQHGASRREVCHAG